MDKENTKEKDIKAIENILSQLGIPHSEYIASVLASNGIGVKD